MLRYELLSITEDDIEQWSLDVINIVFMIKNYEVSQEYCFYNYRDYTLNVCTGSNCQKKKMF